MIFCVVGDELDEITPADFQNRRELSRSNICIPRQPREERECTEALAFLQSVQWFRVFLFDIEDYIDGAIFDEKYRLIILHVLCAD